MKQYNSKHTAALSTRGFYTILTVCCLIIAVSAWVLWSSATASEPAETEASTPIITPAKSIPDLSEDTPVLSEETAAPEEDEQPVPEEQPAESEETAAPTPTPMVTVSAPIYVRPASGAVITPFSGDELLFQPTFGDWRVHTGTDFAAEPGENVLALTDGTVQEVFEDGLYGTCVTLSHDADLTSTYRGLTDVRVVAGQAVTAGETLGAVAETIDAEAALGTHLHVEAARAGTPVDVLELLGESEIE
nr:M23 family metallopeptidase [uncultured Agathobaculum sp.]